MKALTITNGSFELAASASKYRDDSHQAYQLHEKKNREKGIEKIIHIFLILSYKKVLMIKVDGDWRNKSSIRFLNSCRAILFCHLRRQQFFLSSRSLRINEILRALIRSTFLSQLLITLLSSASIRYCLCLQITHINTAAKI